jgi:hypothetical protein
MESSAPHSPALCLQLITHMSAKIDHHCSLCLFFSENDEPCKHGMGSSESRPSLISDNSYYTARTTDSAASRHRTVRTIPNIGDEHSIEARRSLRRKISPTQTSLRELRAKHSRLSFVRAKQSEADLQRAYESQIMAYLDGSLGPIETVKD